jgi:SNF family Na+-dependent transporter
MSTNKESWGSRIGLILAMAGNAVGLGNFLRFPVQAIQNGGGSFIIPYLVCFLLIGIPMLWVEWAMGRFGGRFGYHSPPFIIQEMDKKRHFWKYMGTFGIFINIAVAGYYCYIESWTLSYAWYSLSGTFTGKNQVEVMQFFSDYTNFAGVIPVVTIIAYLICVVLNTYILSKGLQGGIEIVSKIGMPLLIIFGVVLAVRGVTLGSSGAPAGCTDCDAFLGMNYLWAPQYDSLFNPKVWLAAAGQIFFTIAVGMGTIQCYASYVRSKDDIALNAMAAGWMNGFVEVVLGASIVIPIAAGYLGLEWVKEKAGFAMAFQTMPYLFEQWGTFFSATAGLMWFGLLFFAGVTSSLAMGTPWMGFVQDEFNWNREKAALTFGIFTLVLGLPTVFFYNEGIFDDYDYWAGTVALVIFATAEIILFSWIFGMDKGWNEITMGADLKVPDSYRFIIKYITPTLLIVIFIASFVSPLGGDWGGAFAHLFEGKGWQLDNGAIISKLFNTDLKNQILQTTDEKAISALENKIFYINMGRLLLVAAFAFIAGLIHLAHKKRTRK